MEGKVVITVVSSTSDVSSASPSDLSPCLSEVASTVILDPAVVMEEKSGLMEEKSGLMEDVVREDVVTEGVVTADLRLGEVPFGPLMNVRGKDIRQNLFENLLEGKRPERLILKDLVSATLRTSKLDFQEYGTVHDWFRLIVELCQEEEKKTVELLTEAWIESQVASSIETLRTFLGVSMQQRRSSRRAASRSDPKLLINALTLSHVRLIRSLIHRRENRTDVLKYDQPSQWALQLIYPNQTDRFNPQRGFLKPEAPDKPQIYKPCRFCDQPILQIHQRKRPLKVPKGKSIESPTREPRCKRPKHSHQRTATQTTDSPISLDTADLVSTLPESSPNFLQAFSPSNISLGIPQPIAEMAAYTQKAGAYNAETAVYNPETAACKQETADYNPETADYNPETAVHNAETAAYSAETAACNAKTAYFLETAVYNPETGAYNPETAAYKQETAVSNPKTDTYNTETGAYNVETPAYKQETGAYKQETANYNAETADYNPETADYKQETAVYDPETGAYKQETAEYNAETADYNAETADYNAETADYNAETADYNAETADYNSETAFYNAETAAENAKRVAFEICGSEYFMRSRSFCGLGCLYHYKLRSSGSFGRDCVSVRDGGVCCLCSVDSVEYIKSVRRTIEANFGLELKELAQLCEWKKVPFGWSEYCVALIASAPVNWLVPESGRVEDLDGVEENELPRNSPLRPLALRCWARLSRRPYVELRRSKTMGLKLGDLWQADHFLPVKIGGGQPPTILSYRTLCFVCHKIVSKQLRQVPALTAAVVLPAQTVTAAPQTATAAAPQTAARPARGRWLSRLPF